ncbi:tail fiber domain-containing protein [Pseudomonas sp. MSSRFD41]|uniref:tail fiber domain-containing protein n=1 Tax=Pseudomonas sp. MSSRFD41 TaxID=1310370 RepID=UPI00163A38A7|nr:tail fiber domain-containing protein [Pseudomonas sp. MSSRFD41]MBC2659749.1 tail fiber domain-containing protein [Pseudomonas sp. MSSRFD41]
MSGGKTGNDSKKAAEVQAQSQREALNYLKETERLPQAYREGALKGLGAEYGFTTDASGNIIPDGSSISDRAMSSPFYTNAVKVGEEAVLRNASTTGGLRSGNVQDALAQANQNAYLASYANQLSGLQGMAQLPSNANNIASTMSGVGQTMAQGIIGGAQSSAAAQQASVNNAMGAGALALEGYNSYKTFSDARLKDEIALIGKRNGHNVYSWVWNKAASALGLFGKSSGVLAQEVEKTHPYVVTEHHGFKCVDYAAIGVDPHGL